MLGAIAIGLVMYASTNIDDLLVLAVFFADRRVHVAAVIAGRFIGIAALVVASAAAALLALAVPPGWIALLGLAPLLLGLRALRDLRRGERDADDAQVRRAVSGARRGRTAQSLAVAGVTLASGGDNLGVYIPLFAANPGSVPVYVAVFAAMTLVWCALGYIIVNNPLVGAHVRRYGHVLLPVVLIGLGIYILSGARALMA